MTVTINLYINSRHRKKRKHQRKCMIQPNHEIFLKIETCATFLGFSKSYNNKEIETTTDGIYIAINR